MKIIFIFNSNLFDCQDLTHFFFSFHNAQQSAGTDKRTACYSDNWPGLLIESVRRACFFLQSGCLVPVTD